MRVIKYANTAKIWFKIWIQVCSFLLNKKVHFFLLLGITGHQTGKSQVLTSFSYQTIKLVFPSVFG